MTTVRWYCEGRAREDTRRCKRVRHEIQTAIPTTELRFRLYNRRRPPCWKCGSAMVTAIISVGL